MSLCNWHINFLLTPTDVILTSCWIFPLYFYLKTTHSWTVVISRPCRCDYSQCTASPKRYFAFLLQYIKELFWWFSFRADTHVVSTPHTGVTNSNQDRIISDCNCSVLVSWYWRWYSMLWPTVNVSECSGSLCGCSEFEWRLLLSGGSLCLWFILSLSHMVINWALGFLKLPFFGGGGGGGAGAGAGWLVFWLVQFHLKEAFV